MCIVNRAPVHTDFPFTIQFPTHLNFRTINCGLAGGIFDTTKYGDMNLLLRKGSVGTVASDDPRSFFFFFFPKNHIRGVREVTTDYDRNERHSSQTQ